MKSKIALSSIDEYIALQPEAMREKLHRLREIIKSAAPEAEEVISYMMPAFKFNGILVYFALFKSHIGFFPTASGVKEFEERLLKYETSKGTIRLPLDKPLPVKLIKDIVRFRVKENLSKKGNGKQK